MIDIKNTNFKLIGSAILNPTDNHRFTIFRISENQDGTVAINTNLSPEEFSYYMKKTLSSENFTKLSDTLKGTKLEINELSPERSREMDQKEKASKEKRAEEIAIQEGAARENAEKAGKLNSSSCILPPDDPNGVIIYTRVPIQHKESVLKDGLKSYFQQSKKNRNQSVSEHDHQVYFKPEDAIHPSDDTKHFYVGIRLNPKLTYVANQEIRAGHRARTDDPNAAYLASSQKPCRYNYTPPSEYNGQYIPEVSIYLDPSNPIEPKNFAYIGHNPKVSPVQHNNDTEGSITKSKDPATPFLNLFGLSGTTKAPYVNKREEPQESAEASSPTKESHNSFEITIY